MRKKLQKQRELPLLENDHDFAKEFAAISDELDAMPELLDLVDADLKRGLKKPNTGKKGMSAEQVLRALVLKQITQYNYEWLAYHIDDSRCFRRFCRYGLGDQTPKKSTLQENISKISAKTLEAINRVLLAYARTSGLEKGRKTRTDSTVTATNIHAPRDSAQLKDVVRVLCRMMTRIRETFAELPVRFTDHTKRAKRRNLRISQGRHREKERTKLYRDLVKVTKKTIRAAVDVANSLRTLGSLVADAIASRLDHFARLGRRVVDQTERRVFRGESVPASEKVVSIFEEHTDVIVKSGRATEYGHKLNLTTGSSGLVLDCVVERGNPADASRAVPLVERLIEIYGRAPRQVAFDGGYASKANLKALKDLGVKDVSFSKKRGLKVSDMVKSPWVYRQLKRFRSGIESGISFLKRCFGLRRCTWHGEEHFESYVWGSVVAHNLLVIARHRIAKEREAENKALEAETAIHK